ncbi:MAG: hypothetical protein JWP97_1956 [Labilithrix sp.]|nr:hypothetical protein [Labilithrix sp.]
MRISDRYERFTERASTSKAGATDKTKAAVGKGSAEKPAAATPDTGVLTVQVSDRAATLAAGAARLEQLKDQIRSGTFKVDAKAIADKLVGEDG